MALSRDEVVYIAELAKLQLSEEEIALYAEQLSVILGYMDELNALDTDDIPPTASVLPLQNVMRPDNVEDSQLQKAILENAPDSEAGQFRVRAILDE